MMDQSSRGIMLAAAACGLISLLYFLSLVCRLPLAVSSIIIGSGLYLLYRYGRSQEQPLPGKGNGWPPYVILTAGVFLLTNRSYYLALKWGDWDAWGIWNYHARFLADGQRWTWLFQSLQYDHPDYPLGLSALLGLAGRLLGPESWPYAAFALHFLITLSVPVLIFLLLYRNSLWTAGALLLLFVTDDYYLFRGLSQYADTMLAAYFLMAIASISFASADRRLITLSALLAGCAAWTKNEGIVLCLLTCLFYAKTYFSRPNRWYALAGFALPATTLALFKIFYAPANDLVQNSQGDLLRQITDPERYRLVWAYFIRNGADHFIWTGILILVYAIACIMMKRLPGRAMMLILTCLLAYLSTYILSPYDPDWHLHLSLDRLMHQLMPALVLVCGLRISEIRLPLRTLGKKPLQ